MNFWKKNRPSWRPFHFYSTEGAERLVISVIPQSSRSLVSAACLALEGLAESCPIAISLGPSTLPHHPERHQRIRQHPQQPSQ